MIENITKTSRGYRATIDGIALSIPDAPGNRHWEAVQAAIAEGAAVSVEDVQASDPRASMVCSRLQGRLVLGPETCAAIDALAVDPATPWAMRQTIANAIEWRRTSQAMTELGYLLGYTDAQMDDLFRIAMTVDV